MRTPCTLPLVLPLFSFFLCPSFLKAVLLPTFIVFLLHGIVAGELFRKGINLIFKEMYVNGEIGSGFFSQNVTLTLSRLVRISKTRYRWKDLSLLTLLLTNLLT